jgi:uncharacterized membrane protein YbaN (DUF454 family)
MAPLIEQLGPVGNQKSPGQSLALISVTIPFVSGFFLEKRDYTAEVRKHGSLTVRLLFLALGTALVALGIAGAFLPVLPTTPFMLLAAACYARASTRFYNGLLNNRWFGPTILEWRRYRSIPYRVKWTAIVLMAVTLGVSIAFFVPWIEPKLALAAFGVLLVAYLYNIPSRDQPRR